MTVDHVGLYLFPHLLWMRMVGRLAFPIFAFMLAEGCRHTRSMKKHLISTLLAALVCQIVMFLFGGSLYQCIFVTFSMSIGLILLLDNARNKATVFSKLLALAGFAGAFAVCELLPRMLRGTDFAVDYGFIGVLIPVAVYLSRDKVQGLLMLTMGLVCLAMTTYYIQWLALLAVPLLLLYNGTRGKLPLKWFFYLYYPLHLVIIFCAMMLMQY